MDPGYKVVNRILSNETDGFPVSQVLEHPMIATQVWMKLTPAAGQKSPYFELRGCNLESKLNLYLDYLMVPHHHGFSIQLGLGSSFLDLHITSTSCYQLKSHTSKIE